MAMIDVPIHGGMPHGFLITPNNPEKVLVSVGISQRGVYVMSDGTNFILGQANDAESQTKLIRVGDDTSASLFVQNEGDSLLAVSFLGTAVEGQIPASLAPE